MRSPITHHAFSYDLGPIELTGFGIAIALAFVLGQSILQHEIARRGHDPEPVTYVIIAAMIGGLLGGKLYYAVATGDVSSLWSQSGLTYWGGLIGGVLGTWILIHWQKFPFTRVSDAASIGVAAAYAVGRTGCWAVGDDYGLPWNAPLAVRFPEGAPPSTAENLVVQFGVRLPPRTLPDEVIAVHPTQLYQTALAFTMFFVLWRMRDHKHAEGWLFGLFFVLAGAERFLVEFVRAKDDRIFGVLTTAQVIALLCIVGGSVWMYLRRDVRADAPGIHAGGHRYPPATA